MVFLYLKLWSRSDVSALRDPIYHFIHVRLKENPFPCVPWCLVLGNGLEHCLSGASLSPSISDKRNHPGKQFLSFTFFTRGSPIILIQTAMCSLPGCKGFLQPVTSTLSGRNGRQNGPQLRTSSSSLLF